MKFKTSFTLILPRFLLLLSLLIGLGVLVGGRVTPAHAATTTINSCDATTLSNAISNAASGDTISFGCSGDILLTSTLTISKNLTLDGSGQSVSLDGGNSVQVLSVSSGVSFTLNALTIAHGSSGSGSGLLNSGTVSITNSTIANNSASAFGGGIQNVGSLSITNSTIANNSSPNAGGILNNGTLSISNSTFSGNSTGSGSGGGGIQNFFGTLSISNSTFSGNTAAGAFGGGIWNNNTLSISNSTFANNSASGSEGGGLFTGFGTVSISNSTFANNSASSGGGIWSNPSGGTVNIGESIVADNTGGDCNGSLADQGYNLESVTGCGFTDTGSLQNANPMLDPSGLQNNGGPTQTIALLATSPAIDHIPAASCPATDQRGVIRLPGEHCDIGAFEFPDTTAPTLTLPGTITVNGDSSGMAVVTYTATATDDDGDPLAATCAPASGSTFFIGTTTVNCSASEPGSNTASGSFSVVVRDITPPSLSLPGTITVNATSPQGASVTYTVAATDDDGIVPVVTCTPASGSTFAIGTTTVFCLATDAAGNSTLGNFQVVVNDTDLGLSNVPSNMTVNASSPQGAVVTYTLPTAVDEDSSAPAVSCTPTSGSTFAIGTTTVTCTATDSDDTPSSVSRTFTVTVKGAVAQVNDLITTVNKMGLASNLQNALDAKLQDVLTAINAGQTATACSELTDFIGFVQSHTGKGISSSQATTLIKAATNIQGVLGC